MGLALTKVHAVSTNIPPESDLYRKLEKLSSFGLIRTRVEGVNPLSRQEYARLLKEAMERRGTLGGPRKSIDLLLEELSREFEKELKPDQKESNVRVFDELRTKITVLEEEPLQNLETNSVNKPLLGERAGEGQVNGFNLTSNISAWVKLANISSFYIEPRLVMRNHSDKFELDIHRGNLKFGAGKWELLAGRDSTQWGYGYSGKIELGNNMDPLTMVRFSNSSPVYLPWIFKYLGLFQFSFFFSVLEDERDHDYPTFWGTSFFFRPSPYVEWGFSRTTMLGGEGTTLPGFWSCFVEALTGIRIYDSTEVNGGNGTFGFYFLFTLPFLRNTKLHFDGYLEDMGWGNLVEHGYTFTRDLAFNTGISIPRIDDEGRFSFKGEFVKTSEITYRSGVYPDGYTYKTDLMGHHIGPDAMGSYSRFTWEPEKGPRFDIDFNYERHGRLGLTQHSTPMPPSDYEVPEDRFITIFGVETRLNPKATLKVSVGFENIVNYSFKKGDSRNAGIGEIELAYRF